MRMYYLHSRRKERRYMKQWLNPLSVTQGWAAQMPVPWPFSKLPALGSQIKMFNTK